MAGNIIPLSRTFDCNRCPAALSPDCPSKFISDFTTSGPIPLDKVETLVDGEFMSGLVSGSEVNVSCTHPDKGGKNAYSIEGRIVRELG